MRKLSMLAAASVLVLSTAASAGQLELKVKNINGNGNAAANDGVDTSTGVTTIDRPGYILGTIVTPNPTDPHAPPVVTIGKIKSTGAALAAERVVSEDHPFDAHFELNATRFDADSSLTEFLPDEFLLMLDVSGATFKTALNGEDLIRNGMMGEGNLDADVLGNTGGIGDTHAEVSVVNQGNNRHTDFGLLLPLTTTGGDNDILTPCEPIQVQVQAFSTVGFGGPQALGNPDVITIMTCENSFGSSISQGEAKVDFQSNFKSFLDVDHNPVDSVTIGSITVDIWNNLFDSKADPDSDERIVDSSDVDSHEVVLQFVDLTGIEEVNLVDAAMGGGLIVAGDLDRNTNTVTFTVTDEYTFSSEDIVGDIDHDGSDETTQVEESVTAWVELVPFPEGTEKFTKVETPNPDPKLPPIITKVPTGAGAIEHQAISVISNTLNLAEPCKERDGVTVNGSLGGNAKAPKFICEIPLTTGPLGELTLTGQNFGPFDWVGQGNGNMLNFFRVSHLPLIDGHGDAITELKGIMTLKNSTGNGVDAGEFFDGPYKFSFPIDPTIPNQGANGVYLIGPGAIANVLNAGGAPSGAFGTTDVSFTFFVNSAPGGQATSPFGPSENFKIDVDRLMMSGGTMTPFGDNSNDSNSDHAVSGDNGRFGPKVPLKFIKDSTQ